MGYENTLNMIYYFSGSHDHELWYEYVEGLTESVLSLSLMAASVLSLSIAQFSGVHELEFLASLSKVFDGMVELNHGLHRLFHALLHGGEDAHGH